MNAHCAGCDRLDSVVEPILRSAADWAVVVDFPSNQDVQTGTLLTPSSPEYRLLAAVLPGFDRRAIVSTIGCYRPAGDTGQRVVNQCVSRLYALLEDLQVGRCLLFGEVAFRAWFPTAPYDEVVGQWWRGGIPSKPWMMCVRHPREVLHRKNLMSEWQVHISRFLAISPSIIPKCYVCGSIKTISLNGKGSGLFGCNDHPPKRRLDVKRGSKGNVRREQHPGSV